jgi:hypothetical protein
LGNDHDLLVEGNYVEGGDWGLYSEGSFTNVRIHNNTFKNVAAGVYFFIQGSTNITCSFNTIELAATPKDAYAFLFQPPYAFRNIAIVGNTIQFSGAPAKRTAYALYTKTASGVSFLNNRMDNRLLVEVGGSMGTNIYNNLDLVGNSLQINQDRARGARAQ